MSGRGRPSLEKRRREQQRQQRAQDKANRRAERRSNPRDIPPGAPGQVVDPDLEGIVPGPQRQPWMEDPTE